MADMMAPAEAPDMTRGSIRSKSKLRRAEMAVRA